MTIPVENRTRAFWNLLNNSNDKKVIYWKKLARWLPCLFEAERIRGTIKWASQRAFRENNIRWIYRIPTFKGLGLMRMSNFPPLPIKDRRSPCAEHWWYTYGTHRTSFDRTACRFLVPFVNNPLSRKPVPEEHTSTYSYVLRLYTLETTSPKLNWLGTNLTFERY